MLHCILWFVSVCTPFHSWHFISRQNQVDAWSRRVLVLSFRLFPSRQHPEGHYCYSKELHRSQMPGSALSCFISIAQSTSPLRQVIMPPSWENGLGVCWWGWNEWLTPHVFLLIPAIALTTFEGRISCQVMSDGYKISFLLLHFTPFFSLSCELANQPGYL